MALLERQGQLLGQREIMWHLSKEQFLDTFSTGPALRLFYGLFIDVLACEQPGNELVRISRAGLMQVLLRVA